MYNPLIDIAGNLGAGLAQGATNFQGARVGRREQLMKDSQAAFAAGDIQGAYQLAKQADGVQGLMGALTERQGPKLIGTYDQKTVEAPRSSAGVVGPQMGVMVKQYDASKPDFGNTANVEAIRQYVGAKREAPSFAQWDPYKDVVDERTGRVVRRAKDKPATPHYVMTVGPDGRPAYAAAAAGLPAYVKPEKDPAPHYVEDYQPDGTVRHVPVRPGMVTRPKPPANTAEDKEIAKRREAATIVGRAITKGFGGVAKVLPGSADIELDGMYPMGDKQRRMLENAAIDMGGFLYEEPGKKPRIILNPGSTASGVSSKLRDPALTWAANPGGSKTLVEKKAGVTSAAPPPKPATPKAPPKWTPEMDSGARRDARQMVADENAGMVPSGPEGKRDVEDAYKLLKAQRMRDMGIQGEKSALERLIEMDEQKQKARAKK